MNDTTSVPLRSKRRTRAQLMQHLQHAIPAVGLALTGGEALRSGAHGFELGLAIAEVVTSTILVIAVARHLRHPMHAEHHDGGVDWVTLFAAAMLFTEAAEKWQRSGRIWTPQTLTAVATLVTAFLSARLSRRRARRRMLTIAPDAVTLTRGRFRRNFSAPWTDITGIEIDDRDAAIRTRGGDTGRIDLADLHNAAEVVAVLRDGQARLSGAASD